MTGTRRCGASLCLRQQGLVAGDEGMSAAIIAEARIAAGIATEGVGRLRRHLYHRDKRLGHPKHGKGHCVGIGHAAVMVGTCTSTAGSKCIGPVGVVTGYAEIFVVIKIIQLG